MRKLLIVLVLCSPVWATNYFVTQSGAGSQNGTSLGNAWSLANYNASGTPTGGDTVFFSGTITGIVIPNTNGTGNGASRLTLDFTGTCGSCSAVTLNGDPGVRLNTRSFITLNGGTVATASSTMVGTNATIVHDITMNGMTHTGAGGSGGNESALFDAFNGGAQFVTLSNNFCDNCVYGYNDTTNSHDILITGNYIASSPDTTQQTDVIAMGDAYNITIEKNKLINRAPGNAANSRHNDVIQTYRSGHSPFGNPTNWIIRYNWLERAENDGSGGNMSWNEIENVTGQPALQEYGNVYVGGTTSWNGGNGISLHSFINSSDTFYFYNNTFYVHSDPINPLRLGEAETVNATLFFRNNAMSANGSIDGNAPQITMSAGATWNRNFFFHWGQCSGTFSGANGSCSTNPLFTNTAVNNFSTQAGSPLRNAGDSTIGATYNQGICPGATWPNPALCTRSAGNWDVGAYQASSSGPAFSASPNPVAFGSVNDGSSGGPTTVTVTNTGTSNLVITSVTSNNARFPVSSNTCGTVGAGLTCTFAATFSPLAPGAQSATITIADNAGNPDTVTATGTGIGIGPTVSLTCPTACTSLAFGQQVINTTSGGQIVTLTNGGNATLNIASIALTTGTQFGKNTTCGSTLAQGASCTVTVTFRPTSTGAKSDSLVFTTDASTSPDTVSLSGTGVLMKFLPNHIGCTGGNQTTTSVNTVVFSCAPQAAGDAILLFGSCHPTVGSVSAIGLSAGGYTTGGTGPGSIFQRVAPTGTGAGTVAALFGVIALNTSLTNFTFTFTGASDCSISTVTESGEFTGNDSTGGSTTFNAQGQSGAGSGGCPTTSVTPPLANQAVWNVCLDGVSAVNAPWILAFDDTAGDMSGYQVLSGNAGVAQPANFTGGGGPYILMTVAVAPNSGAPPPPPAPATNMLLGLNPPRVPLLWTASVTPGVDYSIWRSTAGASFVKVKSGITGTSWTDNSVSLGQSYAYETQAYFPPPCVQNCKAVMSNKVSINCCP